MPQPDRAPINDEWEILLYYKFVAIENPAQFAHYHLKWCKELGLKGRILVAEDGINGTVGGPKEVTQKYMEGMKQDERFADMQWKKSTGSSQTFKKMFVRHRSELVTMKYKEKLDPRTEAAPHIKPKDLKKMYDNKEDFVIIDMRNNYEYEIGRFQNAIKVDMENFKELPEIVEKELIKYKDKKIVTYCTGGIRCEPATALLRKKGFKDVQQLEGGIHMYAEEFPDDYWEGELYVFDERVSIPINNKVLSHCIHCRESCSYYINCTNLECNKLIICCEECRKKYNNGCSDICSKKPRPIKERTSSQ